MREIKEAIYEAVYHFTGTKLRGDEFIGYHLRGLLNKLSDRFGIELVQSSGRVGGYEMHHFRFRDEVFVYDSRYRREQSYRPGCDCPECREYRYEREPRVVSRNEMLPERNSRFINPHSSGNSIDIDWQQEVYSAITKPEMLITKRMGDFMTNFDNLSKKIDKEKEKQKRREKYQAEKKLKKEYNDLCDETGTDKKDFKKISMYTVNFEIERMKAEKAKHVLTMENLKFILNDTKGLSMEAHKRILNHFKKYNQNG